MVRVSGERCGEEGGHAVGGRVSGLDGEGDGERLELYDPRGDAIDPFQDPVGEE